MHEQEGVLTAIVGSYPKPEYVYANSGRELLDRFGGGAFAERRQEVGDKAFDALLDEAAVQAISDQNQAGIDIITDGEERRDHYVMHVVDRMGGVDAENRANTSIRGGTAHRQAPRVVGRLAHPSDLVVDEFLFTQERAKGTAKIGLPGPSTVADCVADEFYGDKEQLAYDYAAAIRHEVKALIDVGCTAIQFDDPVLLRYPNEAKAWGLDALEQCFAGYEHMASFIVHICCGYPDRPLEAQGVAYKADSGYYRDVLSWLSASTLHAVSIEGAQSNLDASVLDAIGQKTVMLGVLDVGDNTVESVDNLVARGREALEYLPKEQLILAPDCGMVQITQEAAKAKLTNLALAARQLNED
ncbi:MAG TPA: hypothetical protein VK694_02200 [Verrucomicrobiae bacterium]|nr:hypothetical protein [Verrucomicrobiae bacterium]